MSQYLYVHGHKGVLFKPNGFTELPDLIVTLGIGDTGPKISLCKPVRVLMVTF